jgi:DNA-binding CsgD family transcriptional regulator
VDDSLRKRNVTITLRSPLRAALEESAGANDRSLSAEIEHQLEEQARFRELIPALKRPGTFSQMAALALSIDSIEKITGKPWDEDKEMIEEVLTRAIAIILDLKRSPTFIGYIAARLGRPTSKTIEPAEPHGHDEDQDLSPHERPALELPLQDKQKDLLSLHKRQVRLRQEMRKDLSPRECQVWDLWAQGWQDQFIANKLDMRESTVKVHIRHFMEKLETMYETREVLPTGADLLGAKTEVGKKIKRGQK